MFSLISIIWSAEGLRIWELPGFILELIREVFSVWKSGSNILGMIFIQFRDGSPLTWLLGLAYYCPLLFPLWPSMRARFIQSWSFPLSYVIFVMGLSLFVIGWDVLTAFDHTIHPVIWELDGYLAMLLFWPVATLFYSAAFLSATAIIKAWVRS